MITVVYTTVGIAALANAQQTGFAPVVIAAIGVSPNAIAGDADAMRALTTLPAETKRITTVGGELASPSLIHVTATDHSTDVYSVRAVGIYTDDDVLLAVYSQATVIFEKAAQVSALIPFDVPLLSAVEPGTVVIGGDGFSVPPATPLVRGVAELATPEEVLGGTDDERIVTPLGLKAALRRAAWRNLHLNLGA